MCHSLVIRLPIKGIFSCFQFFGDYELSFYKHSFFGRHTFSNQLGKCLGALLLDYKVKLCLGL